MSLAFEDTPEFWKSIVGRLLRNARPNKHKPLWVIVSDMTAHGSTYSRDICKYFGLDPDATKRQPFGQS
jgi:hypothetical protein